MRVRKLLG
jgi:hypothetical protein